MKIKLDHVTNSSSCSYIFCIPKDFDLRGYITQKLGPEDVEDENFMTAIDSLIGSNFLYECDSFSYYSNIVQLLKDFQIAGIDTDSDHGEIQIVYLENIQKQIKEKGF